MNIVESRNKRFIEAVNNSLHDRGIDSLVNVMGKNAQGNDIYVVQCIDYY